MNSRTLLVLALVLAACSGSGADTTTTTTVAGTAPATIAAETPAATEPTTPPATTATTAPVPTTTTPIPRSSRPPTQTTTGSTRTTAPTSGTPPSRAPSVTIATPGSVERYRASYDAAAGNFGAMVTFAASVTDPDGDAVTVEWYSDLHGFLGTGTSLAAWLQVFGDASQPVITAVAVDSTGARSQASRQVIVWIPSDT